MPALTYRSEITGDTATLYLSGDIDIATAEPMAAAGLAHLRDPDIRGLIVECSGVGFCDSTGLGMLVAWRKEADLQHKSLQLRAVPDRMGKIVRMTGLEGLLGSSASDDGY